MKDNLKSVSLSVILPCYNVEQYLDRSLGCLERQWDGRTDYEIIMVNDASTDGTIHKLNEFRNRYPNNVIVIDKAVNEGVGMARNSGLDVANGKWIAFMDPDDALRANSYSNLLKLVESDDSIDILSFGVKVVPEYEWVDTETEQIFQGNLDSCEPTEDFMVNRHFATSISYLYKKSLIGETRFPALIFLEDVLFVLPLFLNDAKIGIVEEKAYYYIVRKSSTTNMLNVERLNKGCDDVVVALQMMDEMKHNHNHNSAIQAMITERQQFYGYNLFTRLLLSGKNKSQLQQIRKKMDDMSLLPFMGAGLKTKFYNFLFRHLNLMLMFRPVYRQIRKR